MAVASPFHPMLLISLAFLLIHHGFISVNGDERFVRDTCSKTDFAKYCNSVLLANSSSLTADLPGLATISDWSLLLNLTEGRQIAVALSRNATGQYKVIGRDCIESYDSGIRWGLQSISSIASKAFSNANREVGWASDGASLCQDLYEEFNLTYPERLLRQQNTIGNLADLAIKLVDLNGK